MLKGAKSAKVKSARLWVSLMWFANLDDKEFKLFSYNCCKPGSRLKSDKKEAH